MKKREIKTFGFELEGEFSEDVLQAIKDMGFKVKNDASLRRCNLPKCKEFEIVEVVTPVLAIKEIEKVKSFFDLLVVGENYHFNKSMGFHVHVGAMNGIRSKKCFVELFSIKFKEYMEKKLLNDWGEILLNYNRRHNSYCQFEQGLEDESLLSLSRYQAVNLIPAWSKHKTIEIRAFPACYPEMMFKMLKWTINIIDKFLSTPPKLKLDNEIRLGLDGYRSFYFETITKTEQKIEQRVDTCLT